MGVNQRADYSDGGFILPAMAAWCAGAIVSLLLAALVLLRFELSGSAVGYLSSSISFLAAFAAGAAAGRIRRTGALYSATVAAAAIVTALLSVGFIIAGPELPSSGVISVVSFTFTGCAAGAVTAGSSGGRRRAWPKHN